MSAKLPSGILKSDTSYPKVYTGNTYESFELWDIRGLGFVIPSLLISRAGRRQRMRISLRNLWKRRSWILWKFSTT
jgi:hypothetical protein